MYVRFENDAQTAHQFLVQLLNASDTYQADLQLRNTGGGTLYNRWGFSSYQDWMDSALARDTWRRIDYEFQFTGGGVSTDFTKAYIYDPADDTVLVDTLQAQSFNLVKTLQVGVPQAGGVDVNLDSLALTLDGSNPGPYTESSGPTAEGWFIKVGGVEVPMTSHVKVGGTEVAATSHIKVAGTEQPVP